ncbi:MAG: DegT/DnrJ/EryC1/StrS family aminotransferase [Rhodoferax sp.]|uniref:DegT/DnrJ/EryC1/StrS family aminotransferase n=1 Tax=Rhodoferax sp. TaxID=50421 RepID=UPI0032642B05
MQTNAEELNGSQRPLPRGPVLDWSSFGRIDVPDVHSVENLKNKMLTTSGRAAIYQALLQLDLPVYSSVLVPTYHCPTMVAPVLLANLNVAYFGLLSTGLPNLDAIEESTAQKCKVMLVPHYFGLAKSLKEVRQWCDKRGIALIEDCAHCYFGQAGERAVGEWGDFATASLSKFFPLPEAGLLASAKRLIKPVASKKPSLKAQIKGCVDVIELASRYHRFFGIHIFLALFFKLKNIRSQKYEAAEIINKPEAVEMMRDCDMTRIDQSPLWAAIALKNILPRGRIILQRQINFASYASYFSNVPGAKPLFPISADSVASTAPYVFPLWVDDPDSIYQALRALKLPVFRWDRIWPNTPNFPEDTGALWSHHVLQLLCHQDLNSTDIDRTAQAVLDLLKIQQIKIQTVHT